MADELEKIKNKSSKEFERLIKADLTKLSKGKNLKGIKNTFSILLKYLHKAQAATKSRHACAKNRTIFSVARAADNFNCGLLTIWSVKMPSG